MNPTDDIVSSRRKGQPESQRQRFSVDRAQAILKMRQFALADPSYYLLELVQAAIANGGVYINMDLFRLRRERDDLKMWWSGRGFSQLELTRLFDFLLMREDEPGCADTILLARGVNAMLHFKPHRITISCGDQTLDNSRQVLITADGEVIEQTPAEPIGGVRIHGDGLRRSLLRPGPEQVLGDRETALLRDKVIAPAVQVMLNGRFVSDWNGAYAEQISRASAYVAVDEDDLYGRIWKTPTGKERGVDLMTYGVKIERLRPPEDGFMGVSGAINFNRLNKTADHAKIVRDEVLDELWARLRPYANHLRTGKRYEITYAIERLDDGRKFSPPQLVELLRDHDRIVVVRPRWAGTPGDRERARRVGEALESPVIVVPESEQQTLEKLAAADVELVAPQFDQSRDLDVFNQPPACPPPRPWLVEPLSAESLPVAEFGRLLCEEREISGEASLHVEDTLGAVGDVDMRVYSPEGAAHAGARLDQRWITVLVCERVVWRGELPTPFRGHQLYVELPAISPTALDKPVLRRGHQGRPLVELIAQTALELARPQLREANDRALRAMSRAGVEPGSIASRMALDALGRTAVLRVRSDEQGDKIVRVTTIDQASAPLLDVPLFESLGGDTIDARVLETMLARNEGVLYGTLGQAEMQLNGLRGADIIALDAEQEELLVSFVGADAYVRLDTELDVDSSGPLDERKAWQIAGLLREPVASWEDQEAQRRARRRLLRFVVDYYRHTGELDPHGISQLPLIDTRTDDRCSFADIARRFERGESVVIFDGRARDAVEQLAEGSVSDLDDDEPIELHMNPALLFLLDQVGPIEGVFDYDLSHDEAAAADAASPTAYIDAEPLEDRRVRGIIGLPTIAVERPSIALVEAGTRRVHRLREPAREFRVVGRLVVREASLLEETEWLDSLVAQTARALLERLIQRLPRIEDADERALVTEALLGFAGQKLRVYADFDDRLRWEIADPLAERILDVPLFPTRRDTPVSGLRLVQHFCAESTPRAGEEAVRRELADTVPGHLEAWIRHTLGADAVYLSPPGPNAPAGPGEWKVGAAELLDTLELWLDQLRPDRNADPSGPSAMKLRWLELHERRFIGEPGLCHVCEEAPNELLLDPEHPIIESVLDESTLTQETLAWLLLATYAHINAREQPVTNDHELAFQRAIADALQAGELSI